MHDFDLICFLMMNIGFSVRDHGKTMFGDALPQIIEDWRCAMYAGL